LAVAENTILKINDVRGMLARSVEQTHKQYIAHSSEKQPEQDGAHRDEQLIARLNVGFQVLPSHSYFGQPPAGFFLLSTLTMACSKVPSNGSRTSGLGPGWALGFFASDDFGFFGIRPLVLFSLDDEVTHEAYGRYDDPENKRPVSPRVGLKASASDQPQTEEREQQVGIG
jgi:hypothetical protein